MTPYRLHRFPPLTRTATPPAAHAGNAAQLQASLAAGFQEGMERGYREGYDSGLHDAREEGLRDGRAAGLKAAREEAQARLGDELARLAAPLEATLEALHTLQADYQTALRKEVVELVAKVARQVIRCELALQPAQLLALVDETLATMPPARQGVDVYLNSEDLVRIRDIAPEKAARWTLIADTRLEPGECRVKADGHEADAGCRQRLAACVKQVEAQLLPSSDEARTAA